MKYLRRFETEVQYQDTDLDFPNASYVVDNNKVHVLKRGEAGPMNFTALDENSLVKLDKYGSPTPVTFEVSKDGGSTWNTYTLGTWIQFSGEGDSVIFRNASETTTDFSLSPYDYYHFYTNRVKASGSVMSLLRKDGKETTIPCEYCFYRLFNGAGIYEAPELTATTLAPHCYEEMFGQNMHLTDAPELYATTLATACYKNMFGASDGLVSGPTELPAKSLANECYYGMFHGCTDLVNPPAIKAVTLAEQCCYFMFAGCTSLTSAPELKASRVDESRCYEQMFDDCSSLNYIKTTADYWDELCAVNFSRRVAETGTFVKKADTEIPTGVRGIPEGWTVEEF